MISKLHLASLASMGAVFIALTGCNSSQITSTSTPETHSSSVAEKPADAKNKDENYMVSLGLMKGHLIVAKELLDMGKPDQAEPHVGHPVEEIYVDVESELSARKVPEFKMTLNRLHELVKSAPNDPKVATQYEASIKAIDQAIAAVPETARQSPEFVSGVINGLLDAADEEYKSAISGGKVAEVIEYQDSRGFVMYADILLKGITSSMSKENPKGLEATTSSFTKLKKAWPTVVPPVASVMMPKQVSELIETIKKNS